MLTKFYSKGLLFAAVLLIGSWAPRAAKSEMELLNASYDPTREFYHEFNQEFQAFWKEKTKQDIIVRQSHGGSGKQARAIIDGLEADVATLALAFDIDAIHKNADLLPENWQSRLSNNSCPYTSTIIFLVRKDNPKGIRDWDDLAKPGVAIITPNPKTSGGARWNYLAAWGYAMKKWNNDEAKAQEFVGKIFQNVPVLDTGARGSTNTFLRGMGDVMLAWENEALLVVNRIGKHNYEIVIPSLSILAEPPVALIDKNADKHKTREAAEAYLNYLYGEKGQNLCAKHYYRPSDAKILEKNKKTFPEVITFTIEEMFGGWEKAQETHFSDGGVFDQLYQPKKQ